MQVCVYADIRMCRDDLEWRWDVQVLAMIKGRKRGEKILFRPSVETDKKNDMI